MFFCQNFHSKFAHNVNNAFIAVAHSHFWCENLMSASDKPFRSDDTVTVHFKFIGQKDEKIQCSYFQFKNLKELPDMEFCKIIKEE